LFPIGPFVIVAVVTVEDLEDGGDNDEEDWGLDNEELDDDDDSDEDAGRGTGADADADDKDADTDDDDGGGGNGGAEGSDDGRGSVKPISIVDRI
jgi:hypothetical protein